MGQSGRSTRTFSHVVRSGLRHPMFDADGDINVSRFYPNSEKIDPDSIDFLWKEMRRKFIEWVNYI